MDEKAALDMREDEYVYGEVQAKSFFELLYRLKMIGYFWPRRLTTAAGGARR